MAMARLTLAVKGYSQAGRKLEKLAAIARRPSVPMRQAAVWIAGRTIQVFDEGGHPEKWAPLSLMTQFIRARRVASPRKSDKPMNDSGRLRGSILPTVSEDGNQFGAFTNVEYAPLMQRGGVSTANDVEVRNRRGKGKRRKAGSLATFILHMKGGHVIPPRPFFPDGMGELESWGYHDKIRQIFAEYFRAQAVGGTA